MGLEMSQRGYMKYVCMSKFWSGWLLVSFLGVLSGQICPIEESVCAPFGVIMGTVVFMPGG